MTIAFVAQVIPPMMTLLGLAIAISASVAVALSIFLLVEAEKAFLRKVLNANR